MKALIRVTQTFLSGSTFIQEKDSSNL